jgi:hypothetical protein
MDNASKVRKSFASSIHAAVIYHNDLYWDVISSNAGSKRSKSLGRIFSCCKQVLQQTEKGGGSKINL